MCVCMNVCTIASGFKVYAHLYRVEWILIDLYGPVVDFVWICVGLYLKG